MYHKRNKQQGTDISEPTGDLRCLSQKYEYECACYRCPCARRKRIQPANGDRDECADFSGGDRVADYGEGFADYSVDYSEMKSGKGEDV